MSEVRSIHEGKRFQLKNNRRFGGIIDLELGDSSKLFRLLILLIAVVVIVFCVYQIARTRSHQKMLHTQTALSKTIHRTITTEGFVLREETEIPYNGSGTVVPVAENGSKVAIGDTVAKVYASSDAALDSVRYTELQDALQYYQEISAYSGNVVSVGMELYEQNIFSQLTQLEDILEQGTFAALSDASRALSAQITKKQIAVGKQISVEDKLSELNGQLAALSAALEHCTEIKAEKAGFYMNETDGFESVGEYETVLDITPAGVRQLLNAKPAAAQKSVGKLITQFNWYLVCCVKEEDAANLKVGATVDVSFPAYGDVLVGMKVKAINPDEDGNVAIVFMSNRVDAFFAKIRGGEIKIRTEEYTGYAVDKSAIRTVDGELGVYIQLGNIIRFRKIEIVYSDESVVLVSNKEESGYLRLYDEIIVEGTDLSDGKIID